MESVEELCDSIALLNQSHKILDGKVKTIKNSYRNNTFLLEYEGGKISLNGNAPFEIMSESESDGVQKMKLKTKQGNKVNDVLQFMLPIADICKLEEIVPTMNEIFIETVSKVAKTNHR
jgi:ABC-2 type transport system ATP-binding protein